MKFGFVDEHRNIWSVRVMCMALGLSVSGYYAWRALGSKARVPPPIGGSMAKAAAPMARRGSTPCCAAAATELAVAGSRG